MWLFLHRKEFKLIPETQRQKFLAHLRKSDVARKRWAGVFNCGIAICWFIIFNPLIRVTLPLAIDYDWNLWVTMSIWFLPPFALALAVYLWCVFYARPRRIRCLMNQRGVPICMQCGYDLQASKYQSCPECGQPGFGYDGRIE